VQVTSQVVDHPSGAPALALQLRLGGRVIGYTGDTAWTDTLLDVAAGADLLIAEAYRMDAGVPFHLRHADLAARRHLLTSRRIVLTHMGAEVLDRQDELAFEAAHDGLVLSV
jgi:ribonuclease BN (tRNA processing enzyme)